MPVGIGAAGIVGVAREAVKGTYLAPLFYIPVRSESLNFMQDVVYTRPIRGVPDPIHAVKGNGHVEGDIEFEVTADALSYMLYAARMTTLKTGVGPYNYAYTPSAAAEAPEDTLSISVDRNGETFGYVGCVVTSVEFSIDSGVFVCTMGIIGEDEATQTTPTPTWPVTAPYGADAYTITIGGSGATDVDDFSWKLDDSGEAVFRLGSLAAAYVKFGERSVEADMTRDFLTRAEYDLYKATTEQALILVATSGADDITITTHAMIQSSNEVNLEGQGDLIAASINYVGKYDETATEVYDIVINSAVSHA